MKIQPTPKELRSAQLLPPKHQHATEKLIMNLEQALQKVVEHAHEELRIVRKRAEQKTAARDHGKDYHEAQTAADRLDHYAHLVRRLHDDEYRDGWRDESLGLTDSK
jgi:hypothetical protein